MNELKEPAKWVITPNDTLEVSLHNRTYIVECPQMVVDAHNLAMETLYKQAVVLREDLNRSALNLSIMNEERAKLVESAKAWMEERDKLKLELANYKKAISSISLMNSTEVTSTERLIYRQTIKWLEVSNLEKDRTMNNLCLELAKLRQIIEQDAKAREMQSEAERKVGGV